jgi:hypothetical protein
MIRNDGRWQMSPRLGESDGLVFLFQVYLTASQRMAASGSNSESAGGEVEAPAIHRRHSFGRRHSVRRRDDPFIRAIRTPPVRWFKLYQAIGRYINRFGAVSSGGFPATARLSTDGITRLLQRAPKKGIRYALRREVSNLARPLGVGQLSHQTLPTDAGAPMCTKAYRV